MPRLRRISVPEFPHHVTQRGARNQPVFFSDNDKRIYKDLLLEELQKTELKIWAYCLMDNHVHFIAVPKKEGDLARTFREAHKRYAWLINQREGWRGHLWQERFHSFVMDEPYLYAAVRYVENNPVKAGIVSHPQDYPWSSARAHIHSQRDTILSRCYLQDQISDWAAYLNESTDDYERDFEKHSNGNPLGTDRFIAKLEEKLKHKLAKKPRGRPELNYAKD